MSYSEEQHVALPKLVGKPSYARPAAAVAHTPRPFDPDDLPLEADQTEDERELVSTLPARAYAPGGGLGYATEEEPRQQPTEPVLQPRPFLLKALRGRVLR